VAGNHPLGRIVDVGTVMIKGRQRADDAAHDRHRVGIAAEALVKAAQLFVHHRVARDRIVEILKFIRRWQFAAQQKMGDFHEAALLGELLDRIAAVQQHAFAAVDEGQLGLAAGGRGKTRVIGKRAGLAV